MKILYLITKSNFGGAQKYVFELAVAAKEAGHEVTVACGGTGFAGASTGKLVEKLDASGIQNYSVKTSNVTCLSFQTSWLSLKYGN